MKTIPYHIVSCFSQRVGDHSKEIRVGMAIFRVVHEYFVGVSDEDEGNYEKRGK